MRRRVTGNVPQFRCCAASCPVPCMQRRSAVLESHTTMSMLVGFEPISVCVARSIIQQSRTRFHGVDVCLCLTYFLLIRLSRRFCVGDQGRRLASEGPGHGLYAAPRPPWAVVGAVVVVCAAVESALSCQALGILRGTTGCVCHPSLRSLPLGFCPTLGVE